MKRRTKWLVRLSTLLIVWIACWFWGGTRSLSRVDINTGQIRTSDYFLWIPYNVRYRDTFISEDVKSVGSKREEREWWTFHSEVPGMHINHAADVSSILIFEKFVIDQKSSYTLNEEALELIRARVLMLWKEERFQEADRFVQDLLMLTHGPIDEHQTITLKERVTSNEISVEDLFEVVVD